MGNTEQEIRLKEVQADLLSEGDQNAIQEAIRQLDLSYSPYSGFSVGAGIELEDGSIIGGSNQENASYPLCMCAERVALYHLSASRPGTKVLTMAITARNQNGIIERAVFPCGACRQVILEYERIQNSPIRLLIYTRSEKVFIAESGASILPFAFDESFLIK
ncbi:MAG: cytidine deaminase [Saprospiraceae bacterium]|nr:cytidine deaminase [Saprospiraceae bacterium]MBK7220945.1 cytidine deaminase [Saprospiraceae bacterium]MBK8112449.1 cytidine deaminase [Saprospiraceae bacterium]MBK8850960.1 cytidine deaminase [Saprospiraceae bacterium]